MSCISECVGVVVEVELSHKRIQELVYVNHRPIT